MSRWEADVHARIASAIKKRRAGSAQDLADRTAELGYPISRAQIANYESGRKKNLDIAELLILAAALDVPPMLLLFPTFPDGTVELLPGFEAWVPAAADWLSGDALLPVKIYPDGTVGEVGPANDGVALVRAVTRRNCIEAELFELKFLKQPEGEDATEKMRRIRDLQADLVLVQRDIDHAKAALWGTSTEDASDE